MSFLKFSDSESVATSLCGAEDLTLTTCELFRRIANRLGSGTFDAAALIFVLMEVIRDYETESGQNLEFWLPHCVVSLTGDRDLAEQARQSFHEIKYAVRA